MSQPIPSAAIPSETATSEARLAANRANAQHSTGPRTEEGKARSSQNALKHGCFSRDLKRAAERLGEDRAEFDNFAADLTAEYQPEGPEETLLVDRMAALWWRMQRLAAQQQVYLAESLKAATPLFALAEVEACALHEARLDRMLRAARKDLLAHQAWRLGATERRVTAQRRQRNAEIDGRLLAHEIREHQERLERAARAQAQQEAQERAAAEPEAAAQPWAPEESVTPESTPRTGHGPLPGLGVGPAPHPRPGVESAA